MTRPELCQFFPEGTTPGDIQLAFTCEPELYKYITALDAYVDWLESEIEKSGCDKCQGKHENECVALCPKHYQEFLDSENKKPDQ